MVESALNISPVFVALSFEHSQFGNLRVIVRDGEPWFVASDVAKLIDATPSAASGLASALEPHQRDYAYVATPGGRQRVLIISEAGVYRSVTRSNAAARSGTLAHAFQTWASGDLLVALRRSGCLPPVPASRKTVVSTAVAREQRLTAQLTLQCLPGLDASVKQALMVQVCKAVGLKLPSPEVAPSATYSGTQVAAAIGRNIASLCHDHMFKALRATAGNVVTVQVLIDGKPRTQTLWTEQGKDAVIAAFTRSH